MSHMIMILMILSKGFNQNTDKAIAKEIPVGVPGVFYDVRKELEPAEIVSCCVDDDVLLML